MSDDLDAKAFVEARRAAPELNPDRLRLALDRYLDTLHIHISRAHEERPATPDELLNAFQSRTVEF